ncbi:MAG: hypothetical protein IJU80_06605 [Lachnospiraceae bacterium]|nr:hypothetical protein [Lachnospiraceae bacterium]
MIIQRKEPTVKKSIRLPISCVAIIQEICEENCWTFTDSLVKLLKIGIDEIEKFDVTKREGMSNEV